MSSFPQNLRTAVDGLRKRSLAVVDAIRGFGKGVPTGSGADKPTDRRLKPARKGILMFSSQICSVLNSQRTCMCEGSPPPRLLRIRRQRRRGDGFSGFSSPGTISPRVPLQASGTLSESSAQVRHMKVFLEAINSAPYLVAVGKLRKMEEFAVIPSPSRRTTLPGRLRHNKGPAIVQNSGTGETPLTLRGHRKIFSSCAIRRDRLPELTPRTKLEEELKQISPIGVPGTVPLVKNVG